MTTSQANRMTAAGILPAASRVSEAYRSQAGDYDQRTDAFRQWRELLVASLPLRPGTPSSTPAVAPGCAHHFCTARSAPPAPSSVSTNPSRCSPSPRTA